MLAAFTREEAFLHGASEQNASLIATAMADVSRHYNMSFDSPTISLIKLAGVLAMVNVPIMVIIGQKRAAMRAAAKPASAPPTPDDVFAGGDEARRPYDFGAMQ